MANPSLFNIGKHEIWHSREIIDEGFVVSNNILANSVNVSSQAILPFVKCYHLIVLGNVCAIYLTK